MMDLELHRIVGAEPVGEWLPPLYRDNRGNNADGVFLAHWGAPRRSHRAGCDGCGWLGRVHTDRDLAMRDYLDHDCPPRGAS